MIQLPSTPEFERRLEAEATKRGLPAPEYALRLIEAMIQPEVVTDYTEHERLSAIDELMGIGIGVGFSSDDLHQQRQEEHDREEANYQRLFEGKHAR